MWKQVLSDVIAKTLAGLRGNGWRPWEQAAWPWSSSEHLASPSQERCTWSSAAFLRHLGLRPLRLRWVSRTNLAAWRNSSSRPPRPWPRCSPGLRSPSSSCSRIGALNLQIAMDLVSRAFSYLPQVLIASALFRSGQRSCPRSCAAASSSPPSMPGLSSARFLAAGAHGPAHPLRGHGARAPGGGAPGPSRLLHDPLRGARPWLWLSPSASGAGTWLVKLLERAMRRASTTGRPRTSSGICERLGLGYLPAPASVVAPKGREERSCCSDSPWFAWAAGAVISNRGCRDPRPPRRTPWRAPRAVGGMGFGPA